MKVSEALMVKPLIEKLAAMEMDAKTAMEFAAFGKEILTAVQALEAKRAELFEKYGEQIDDQGNWKIKEENEKKFNTAIKRAMSKEVDIEPFNMSESGLTVTPADVVNILSSLK